MSNAAPTVGISSFLLTKTVRRALRKPRSRLRSMKVSARVASVSLRGPASRPASWRRRANAPRRGSRSGPSGTSRLLDKRRHLLPDSFEVLLVLERGAERRIYQRGVHARGAGGRERARPVQRLAPPSPC